MAITKVSRGLLNTGVSDSSDATAITIDSSERVMIGTTDAGYPDYGDSLTLGDVDGGGGNAGMTIRSGTSSYGTFYFSDATGTAAGAYAGKMQYNHSTNSMVFGTNSSDRLTIDSSGNIGVGTTSPVRPLHVHGATSGDIVFAMTNNSTGATTSDGFNIIIEGPTPDVLLRNRENSNMRFLTNNTERVRIDSAGKFGVNTSTPTVKLEVHENVGTEYSARFFHGSNPNSSPPQGIRVDFYYTPNNGTSEFLKCRDTLNGTPVNRAVIMSNGGIGNYTTNDFNYSDERMKKDISNATAQLDNIKKLQLKTFRYKEQEDSEPTNLGVVAQDIQTDFPALVTEQGEGDEARLGVKEQQIMWMAVKAIQEQQTQIEALQSEINTLKGGD